MSLKDWTIRELKRLSQGRGMDIEQCYMKVNGLKTETLEELKQLIENSCKDTLAQAKTETFKLQSVLEDHMLKDPVPPERFELLKCEIKNEVKDEMMRMSPLLKRMKDSEDPLIKADET